MPIKAVETGTCFFIEYNRLDLLDVDSLKNLFTGERFAALRGDIVIDFAAATSILSAEIGVLARVARMLADSTRKLRIIAGPAYSRSWTPPSSAMPPTS
jgi:hypothetical protein